MNIKDLFPELNYIRLELPARLPVLRRITLKSRLLEDTQTLRNKQLQLPDFVISTPGSNIPLATASVQAEVDESF